MRKAFVLLLATVLMTGCVYHQPVFQGNLLDKANVEQLKPGMNKSQVVALLGTPPIADPFHQERWDYVATEKRGHGKRQIKDLTVWFEGDSLTKMEGEYFPEADPELVKEMRKFGFFNLPKEDKKNQGR
jgi:outer membrane protein assembly factor BamE